MVDMLAEVTIPGLASNFRLVYYLENMNPWLIISPVRSRARRAGGMQTGRIARCSRCGQRLAAGRSSGGL
jgi:hypothetical protein